MLVDYCSCNMVDLDQKDRDIIRELVSDAKQTTSKLGKKLQMPITTVHNRIKKLERLGVIQNYTVNLNFQKLGKPIFAFIGVNVDYQAGGVGVKIHQVKVAEAIKRIPGVQEVTIMTGGADILVKIIASDVFELNEIVTEKMRNVTGVDKTQTSIVLKDV